MSAVLAGAAAQPGGGVEGWDGARLLALIDADMAATAYADGRLHPIADAEDAAIVINPGTGARLATAPVSNTVMGWPGSMVVSRDRRLAYVVSSRGPVDRGLERVERNVFEDFPDARTLTVLEIETGDVLGALDVCNAPMSVDLAPGGDWLLIACRDDDNELTVVPLTDGDPGAPRPFDLDLPAFTTRAIDEGATYAVARPDGRAAGLVLSNRAVVRVDLELGADGVPVAASPGEPLETDRWLSVARWTRSGSALVVADVGWGPRPIDAVLNRNGEIVSFALPATGAPKILGAATVSKSPEAIEFNRVGDLLAVVNMERTYLPGGLTAIFRGRSASSLSLVAIDDATGDLRTLGKPVRFRGVLPEDAVFDADGDRIAVVVYQDHGAPRSDGWITFFRIDGTGDDRRAVETGERIALPRGGHDLAAVD
ncbi:MAG: hypothetical protein AAFR11_11650 [Pseudomonadota bacterium]